MWRIWSSCVAWLFAVIIGFASAPPIAAFAYEAGSVVNGGTVAGTLKLEGTPAKPVLLTVSKDIETCGKRPLYDQSLVVGKDGGVRFAVVTLTDISKGEPVQPARVKFDQNGCEYNPHVAAFPMGSTVEILNSDGILHSIHTVSKVNPVIDMAQPGFKKTIRVTVAKPEVIEVTCDAHNWMVGWWYVTGNPYYAVTDPSGHFTIANIPPGTYTVQVWQEKLGTLNRKVTVKPSATTKADFAWKSDK